MSGRAPNAASVAVVNGSRVLLVRRAQPPYAGLWTLPGGRVEAGETASGCAIREVREELGLGIADLRPLTTIAVGPQWRLAVFASSSFDGEVVPSDEVAAWQWCTLAEAESLQTTPNLVAVLRLALHGRAALS